MKRSVKTSSHQQTARDDSDCQRSKGCRKCRPCRKRETLLLAPLAFFLAIARRPAVTRRRLLDRNVCSLNFKQLSRSRDRKIAGPFHPRTTNGNSGRLTLARAICGDKFFGAKPVSRREAQRESLSRLRKQAGHFGDHESDE